MYLLISPLKDHSNNTYESIKSMKRRHEHDRIECNTACSSEENSDTALALSAKMGLAS
jgi:hypothetical protein